ncbi:MAG: DNA mismatch repair endonuclease MutL [Planctomycetes bacterium]|nr:DNA mismatch repair endonuclease MutL [Planctomycetota bacterium]
MNRIAAGEVVERPASVVKELVENSLDAGATRIEVEVSEGGRKRIAVKDDGSGVPEEDLARIFLPHSTSKLSDVEDLLHIGTFGFRGEALASIGAVARAVVRSRERGAIAGFEVADEFGVISPVRPAASPEGTTVEVHDLFRNVPARLKFLRSASAEMARVTEAVERFAIGCPEASFVLKGAERTVVRFPEGMGLRERIALAFGRDLRDSLVEASAAGAGAELMALLAPPSVTRADTGGMLLFLNGRHVRDKTLLHALRQAYEDLIFGPRSPVAFLFLTMDPALVDQNVHPAKLEVRFRDSGAMHALVYRTVRDALVSASLAVPVVPPPERTGPGDRDQRVREAVGDFLSRRDAPSGLFPPGPLGERPEGAGTLPGRAVDFLQVRDTYIVLETSEGIEILDQHALHERVLFDRIRGRYLAGGVEIQRLLRPVVVDLRPTEVAALEEAREVLRAIGVLVESFGPSSVGVSGLPAAVGGADPADLLVGLLGTLAEERSPRAEDLADRLLSTMACRAAVKAGDRLRREQVADLLSAAERLEHAHSCPHGRPTALRLDYGTLERHFHRK